MIDSVNRVKGIAFPALIIERKPDLARHGLHAAVVRPSAKGGKRELLLLLGLNDVEKEGKGEEEEKRRTDGGLHPSLGWAPPVRRVYNGVGGISRCGWSSTSWRLSSWW